MKNMRKTKRFCTLKLVAFSVGMLFATSSAMATEYFVNKNGNDANAGTSRQAAFLTVQKGVDALQPGDVLAIGPGEYFENVEREKLGGPDADTIIRAEVPGTAVLRGDIPAPEFKKVEGYRFVYAAEFERAPNAIFERNKMHTLLSKANVTELEFDPGFFHYDADSKMLYISNLDLTPPDQCRYTMSVNENSGLHLIHPQRVIIEGLAATGFHPGWGILLVAPVSCQVRECVSFANVGGICMQPDEQGATGSGNLIENCLCYANNFGGIVRYIADNDIIRNNYTYKNIREDAEHFGVMHYQTMKGPILIQNNISWGHNFNLSVKPSGQERLDRNVGLGFIRNVPGNMFNNLVDGGNEFDRGSEANEGNILFIREKEVDRDFEFADAVNLDYRLQPDSRYRGTAPDGSDRGPYEYEPSIFYVSAAGDDGADGLSMRKPWRTLERAFRNLQPGDTVYIVEGEYEAAPLSRVGDADNPIKILGRARGTVVIRGRQNVEGCEGLVLERLNFADGLSLGDSSEMSLKNCTFFGTDDGLSADDVQNLKVTHCVFTNVPVDVNADSRGVILSGNLYVNSGSPAVRLDTANAIRYSDYNNYQNTARAWEVGGAAWSFADLQQRHDQYSKAFTAELAVEEGVPRLKNEVPFKSTGPGATALGIYLEYDPAPKLLAMVGPFVHSTSDTTANIEWWSSHPATFSLAWGQTPETKDGETRFTCSERFNTFSLTDLEPDRTYYFRIVSSDARRTDANLAVLRPENAIVSFETSAAPAQPRKFYVAPDGDDADDGLSRDTAFRTICRAADIVGPGDTVLIANGDYKETVRIRAAGTQDRPITFRSIMGEKPAIRAENLPRSFEVVAKPDLRFDGLYFRGQDFWREGFVIRRSPRVQITRCFQTMVDASDSPQMLVKNCVLHGGWTSVAVGNCPDSLVENNVFIWTILRQLTANADTIARRNIFGECARNKTHQTLLSLSENVQETDNIFWLRWPEEEKLAVNNLPLPIYRAQTGSNAMYGNPMLAGPQGYVSGWPPVTTGDFDEYFSGHPELILKDIGLQPEAFNDFKFESPAWPHDRQWAEQFNKASESADKLVAAGKDKEAGAAFTSMVENLPMCDRLKADLLEKTSRCAERLKNYDQAMRLAEDIPVEPIRVRRQMEVFLAQEKHAELLEKFADEKMGGRDFQDFRYPELEDVMADLYYYRSRAYIQTGNLKAAEADLRFMNDKRAKLGYRCGEAIHDLTWLRLGDFYRTQLKDDARALEAYLNVCKRTTWAIWAKPDAPPPKPVLMGDDETLVKATQAACEILRKQGNLEKVNELQENLAKAQADAAEALQKK